MNKPVHWIGGVIGILVLLCLAAFMWHVYTLGLISGMAAAVILCVACLVLGVLLTLVLVNLRW